MADTTNIARHYSHDALQPQYRAMADKVTELLNAYPYLVKLAPQDVSVIKSFMEAPDTKAAWEQLSKLSGDMVNLLKTLPGFGDAVTQAQSYSDAMRTGARWVEVPGRALRFAALPITAPLTALMTAWENSGPVNPFIHGITADEAKQIGTYYGSAMQVCAEDREKNGLADAFKSVPSALAYSGAAADTGMGWIKHQLKSLGGWLTSDSVKNFLGNFSAPVIWLGNLLLKIDTSDEHTWKENLDAHSLPADMHATQLAMESLVGAAMAKALTEGRAAMMSKDGTLTTTQPPSQQTPVATAPDAAKNTDGSLIVKPGDVGDKFAAAGTAAKTTLQAVTQQVTGPFGGLSADQKLSVIVGGLVAAKTGARYGTPMLVSVARGTASAAAGAAGGTLDAYASATGTSEWRALKDAQTSLTSLQTKEADLFEAQSEAETALKNASSGWSRSRAATKLQGIKDQLKKLDMQINGYDKPGTWFSSACHVPGAKDAVQETETVLKTALSKSAAGTGVGILRNGGADVLNKTAEGIKLSKLVESAPVAHAAGALAGKTIAKSLPFVGAGVNSYEIFFEGYNARLEADHDSGKISDNAYSAISGLQALYIASGIGGLLTASAQQLISTGIDHLAPQQMAQYLPPSLIDLLAGRTNQPSAAEPEPSHKNAALPPSTPTPAATPPQISAEEWLAAADTIKAQAREVCKAQEGKGNVTFFDGQDKPARGMDCSSTLLGSLKADVAGVGTMAAAPALSG